MKRTNRPSTIVRLGAELNGFMIEIRACDDASIKALSKGDVKRSEALTLQMNDGWDRVEGLGNVILSLPASNVDEALIQTALIGARLENALGDLPEGSPSKVRTEQTIPVIKNVLRVLISKASPAVASSDPVKWWHGLLGEEG